MRILMIITAVCLAGCGESAKPHAAEDVVVPDAIELRLKELAEIELKALSAGARSKERIGGRVEYLRGVIDGAAVSWHDANDTREDCLTLEAQMTALLIGRGVAGGSAEVQPRIDRLRALLRQAGYEFDDQGIEQIYDESGNARQNYTRLTEP